MANIEIISALELLETICSDPLVKARVRALLRAYHLRWQKQDLTVLEIEQVASSDLFNPETSAKSRSFQMAGKKDVLLEEAGKLWLMDHKTCSEDIADPSSPYWKQLVIEGQHLHYSLLEHLNGKRVEGAIWDVMRKPSISPKQITKTDQQAIKITNSYCCGEVTEEDIQEMLQTGRENYHLYELRLFNDATRERPDWYFQRQRVARLDNELLEYAGELWGHTQDLLISRRENRWPRNSGACMNYGRPCVFLGICSGHDTSDSDKWTRKAWMHNELPVFGEGNGRELLTNSRIRCFQTCRRKHYFEYELGIGRVEEDEAASLYFGTVWHEVLAVYFQQWRKEESNGNFSSVPASAVGIASN